MNKKWGKGIRIIIRIAIILMIILAIIAFGIHWFFGMSMKHLPKGEQISESISPDGAYTIKIYQANDGLLVASAIRGELNFNHSQKKTEKHLLGLP